MSYNIAQTLYTFENRLGSNGRPAKPLVDDLFAADAPDTPVKILSPSLFHARADYIEQQAKIFFAEQGLPAMKPEAWDSGVQSLVIDCNNDHVLKVRKGQFPVNPAPKNLLLHPETRGYSPELNVSFEIYSKLETKGACNVKDVFGMFVKCLHQDHLFSDPQPWNLGRFKSKQKQQDPIIIDEGAIRPLASLNDFSVAAQTILRAGVVHCVPGARPLYRKLRKTWNNMRNGG